MQTFQSLWRWLSLLRKRHMMGGSHLRFTVQWQWKSISVPSPLSPIPRPSPSCFLLPGFSCGPVKCSTAEQLTERLWTMIHVINILCWRRKDWKERKKNIKLIFNWINPWEQVRGSKLNLSPPCDPRRLVQSRRCACDLFFSEQCCGHSEPPLWETAFKYALVFFFFLLTLAWRSGKCSIKEELCERLLNQ